MLQRWPHSMVGDYTANNSSCYLVSDDQLFSLHVYSPSAGDTKLRECTGICIESSCPGVTSFLTSINLIPLTWRASKITKNLKVTFSLLLSWTIMTINSVQPLTCAHFRLKCAFLMIGLSLGGYVLHV